jgi:hypothetical protein
MIDALNLHDDRDLHAELAAAKRQHDVAFYRIRELTRLAAMEDQRLNRLADAISTVGDPVLGFVGYVVFGPQALPVEPMYEVRVIQGGYGIGDGVRTNLPAHRVETAAEDLKATVVRRHAKLWGRKVTDYQVEVTAF